MEFSIGGVLQLTVTVIQVNDKTSELQMNKLRNLAKYGPITIF